MNQSRSKYNFRVFFSLHSIFIFLNSTFLCSSAASVIFVLHHFILSQASISTQLSFTSPCWFNVMDRGEARERSSDSCNTLPPIDPVLCNHTQSCLWTARVINLLYEGRRQNTEGGERGRMQEYHCHILGLASLYECIWKTCARWISKDPPVVRGAGFENKPFARLISINHSSADDTLLFIFMFDFDPSK